MLQLTVVFYFKVSMGLSLTVTKKPILVKRRPLLNQLVSKYL